MNSPFTNISIALFSLSLPSLTHSLTHTLSLSLNLYLSLSLSLSIYQCIYQTIFISIHFTSRFFLSVFLSILFANVYFGLAGKQSGGLRGRYRRIYVILNPAISDKRGFMLYLTLQYPIWEDLCYT